MRHQTSTSAPDGTPGLAIARRQPVPAQLCNFERLLDRLAVSGLDGIVALYATNQYYLGSYARHSTIPEELGMFPVVISRHAPDHPIICMPDLDIARLPVQPTWIQDVRPYATVLPFDVEPTLAELGRFVPKHAFDRALHRLGPQVRYEHGLAEAMVRAIHDLKLDRGRVGFDNLSTGLALATPLPHMTALPAENDIRFVRQQKTPIEVELLRQATRINQTAQERAIARFAPGMTFRELVFTFQVEALALGGSPNLPDSMQMANGPDTGEALFSDPEVDDFPLERGMHIMFDCHGKYNGYCWDGGKTWVVDDEPSRRAKRRWSSMTACLAAINERARPGVRITELVQAGRQALRRTGVSDDGALIYFHGMGLDHIDMDLAAAMKDWTVEKDSMLSTHIYVPGGPAERLYLEDIVFVRESGVERLFTWDDELS